MTGDRQTLPARLWRPSRLGTFLKGSQRKGAEKESGGKTFRGIGTYVEASLAMWRHEFPPPHVESVSLSNPEQAPWAHVHEMHVGLLVPHSFHGPHQSGDWWGRVSPWGGG